MQGMAFVVAPLAVLDGDVERVHMFDVPTSIREHAYNTLDTLDGGVWWTVGEFGRDFDTAVARRVLRDGRMSIEYGVEICE